MEFECKLTNAEMREAVQLNRVRAARLWRVLRFLRLFMVVGVLLAVMVSNLRSKTPNWGAVVGLAFAAAFLAIVAVWSWAFRDRRKVRRMNAGEQMTIDANGIGTANAKGASSFTPWTQFQNWREGVLVFTVSNAKGFLTIPKSALSEMQIAEVRGILQSQVRA